MPTPKELLSRASGKITPPIPVSAPAPVRAAAPETVEPSQPPQRAVVPQPIRQNSVYHQLMQRHDRAHTRHLQG